MTIGDRLVEPRGKVKKLNSLIQATTDQDEKTALVAKRDRLDEALSQKTWNILNGEERRSEPVVMDSGVSNFIVDVLTRVKLEIERELEREDLYPNIRDGLFKKGRALEDVMRMFYGDRRENKIDDLHVRELLLIEFDDDSVDFIELEDDSEVEEITMDLIAQGGVVTRYSVIPYGGSDVHVHTPLTEADNHYKPLPPDILHRVLYASKGKVRLPDDFEAPDVPPELAEFLRLKGEDGE